MPAEEPSWSVRVAATGRDTARAFVRASSFEVGPPLGFDRESPSITALEHVLGAIGGDLVIGFQQLARRRRLELDAVEATVEARLENPLAFLQVVGEEGEPAMKEVAARLYVTSPASPAALDEVWRELLRTSPLVTTFRRALRLDLTLKILA